ncbi:hypothetical protein PENSPDRAFT_4957 [Peniophora sp. CONT]|nr:hypothetical protein PENSPDRAFT_4957 [Peniophora sp. CONT]
MSGAVPTRPLAADLRFQSNETLPVFQLPNEVLTMVAAYLKATSWNADVRMPKQYPIVALSQACRRWRSITLDATCACCWSVIPLKNANWTQLCLFRSRNSPCSVYIGDNNVEALKSTGPLVKPHMSRVNTIHMCFYDFADEFAVPDHIWELLCCPAPEVAKLRIYFDSEIGTWIDLPSRLLARQNPTRLTSIDLTFCDLGRTPHLLHAPLTQLKLNNCDFWSDINDMLESLRGMPRLQSFIVVDCSLGIVESLTPNVDTPLRSIPMPYLYEFYFQGVIIQAMTVFQYIAAPISMDSTLSQWVKGAEESTFDDLTRISVGLLAHFSPIIAARIYPAHLDLSCHDGVTLGWKYKLPASLLERYDGLAPPQTAAEDDFTSEFDISLPFTDTDTAAFFWPLATELFRGVTSLKLDIYKWDEEPRSAMSLLHCFPNVRSFTAEDATMRILLRELRGATLHTILPHLETLKIVKTAFPGMLFAQFLTSLPIRPSEQGRLKTVTITESGITAECVDILVAQLGDCAVIWDQKTEEIR